MIAQTGQILYQDKAEKVTDPASLTKMMTMYLTLDAIENGEIKGTDKIKSLQIMKKCLYYLI